MERMEKEEKKADLEQLLNSLIEKGWKPFGMKSTFDYVDILCNQPYRFKHLNSRFGASLRELVSKESGLWQFVCENGMIKGMLVDIDGSAYKYYITESALKDENELEDFLLNSIKID